MLLLLFLLLLPLRVMTMLRPGSISVSCITSSSIDHCISSGTSLRSSFHFFISFVSFLRRRRPRRRRHPVAVPTRRLPGLLVIAAWGSAIIVIFVDRRRIRRRSIRRRRSDERKALLLLPTPATARHGPIRVRRGIIDVGTSSLGAVPDDLAG